MVSLKFYRHEKACPTFRIHVYVVTEDNAAPANQSGSTLNYDHQTASLITQGITFILGGTYTFGDAPFGLDATANSGLAVSYSSSDTDVLTISGSTATIVEPVMSPLQLLRPAMKITHLPVMWIR